VATDPSTAPNRPWRAVIAAVACVALLAALPATAAVGASGNPDTLSYFEQVVTDWQSVPGAHVTEYGLFWLHYNGGTAVDFRWGTTKPDGFKAAKAVIDYWLEGGKIVGYLATVTAQDVPRLRILVAAGNVFTSTTQCWQRSNPGSAPFGTGQRDLVSDLNARFEPLQHKGKWTVVKYHYLWSTGTHATQVDTLGPSSPPAIRSKIDVRGVERFSISLSVKPLHKAPELPLASHSPAAPKPAPFCKKAT